MTTASAIIGKSLRMIGVLASGDSGTAAEYADALDGLNSIIDGWSVDPQFYFCEQDETMSLSAKSNYAIGDASVTISSLTSVTTTATAVTNIPHSLETGNKVTVSGAVQANYNITATVTVTSPTTFTYTIVATTSPATGTPVLTAGDLYTIRPIRLLGAYTRTAGVDSPIGIVTEQFWTNIPDKTASAAIPTKILYRPNYPFGQLVVYKVPTGTLELHIKSEKIISQFSDLSTNKLLPPGYQRMLELALAVDLSTEYGTKVSEATAANIKASYQSVLDANNMKLQSLRVNQPMTQQA